MQKRRWTENELELLLDLHDEGLSDDDIFAVFKTVGWERTGQAIKWKRHELIRKYNLNKDVPHKSQTWWNDEQEQFIIDNYTKYSNIGLVRAINEEFNLERTEGSIIGKITDLRKSGRLVKVKRGIRPENKTNDLAQDENMEEKVDKVLEYKSNMGATKSRGHERRSGKGWTVAEDLILVRFYGIDDSDQIASQLGRSISAIENRYSKIRKENRLDTLLTASLQNDNITVEEQRIIKPKISFLGRWRQRRAKKKKARIQKKISKLSRRLK